MRINLKKISQRYATLFKSLSDPNRIEILKLLAQKPWFGQELADQLKITPATISYHLSFLTQLGIVSFTRQDNRSYYIINTEKLLGLFEEFNNYFRI